MEDRNDTSLEVTESSQDKTHGLEKAQLRNILHAIEHVDKSLFHELIQPMYAADMADFLSTLSADNRRTALLWLGEKFDPEIFIHLDPDVKDEVISVLGATQAADAIANLESDDAVNVIEDVSDDLQQDVLGELETEVRIELEERLAYPDDSVGRIIEKNLVSVPEYWNVGQAIDFLRANDQLPDNFYEIFVVDPKFKPVGAVKVSCAMRSQRNVVMNDIMDTDLHLIQSDTDQEEVAHLFRKYSLVSAPVVDEEGKMAGVISIDDIVDVIDEEAEEDIMRMGGVKETDIHSSFGKTVQHRFPWLFINLLTAILASVVISYFEATIQQIVALAVLMPIIASMGGNAGTQTVTVAVRAIATKELTIANTIRVIMKEILVGGINGLLFAVVTALLIYLWYDNLYLACVFGLATIITLMIAGLAGALIPIGLVRLGADPAVASGVFLTTVTDVFAFAVFLGLAAIFLM